LGLGLVRPHRAEDGDGKVRQLLDRLRRHCVALGLNRLESLSTRDG
jgi:hypothetical protein